MALAINDTAPDFDADTTQGKIRFHDWIGNSWVVLFSHPKDFTPICTTELGYMAKIKPEFDKRGVRHQGDARLRAELSDDRRPRSLDRQGVGHAAGGGERRRVEAHGGR